MLKNFRQVFRRGDTIIEVAFAIAIFSLVAIISIAVMNAGLQTAEASMEVTVARNEIDAQAEAIRYIHNSFTLERELPVQNQEYRDLWYKLSRDSNATSNPGMVNSPENLPALAVNSCSEIYNRGNQASILNSSRIRAFIMNTRVIDPQDQTFMPSSSISRKIEEIVVATNKYPQRFSETLLYPRVIYTNNRALADNGNIGSNNTADEVYEDDDSFRYVAKAEGIWVIAVRDKTDSANSSANKNNVIPEFYDFHIRTCWTAPGRARPSTIGTIIRLYNPELVERI
ncbi:hypothetical protein IKE84_02730 [Candidatus Saccharibacteria bacterium]|nr:hypothetical protein [Candidatus Saccharibacteria bacterium]